jgi:hypothetical protein
MHVVVVCRKEPGIKAMEEETAKPNVAIYSANVCVLYAYHYLSYFIYL